MSTLPATLPLMQPAALPTWVRVWRQGLSQVMSEEELLCLRNALYHDSERLLQGSTTEPPPASCFEQCDFERGCSIAVAAWSAGTLRSVGAVASRFAQIIDETERLLNCPGITHFWLAFHDEGDWETVRVQLFSEVTRSLIARGVSTYAA